MKQVEFELLAAELLCAQPDVKRLEKLSKQVGIQWSSSSDQNLMGLMAEVLNRLGGPKSSKSNGKLRRPNSEVEV